MKISNIAICTCGIGLSVMTATAVSTENKPNIIIILADDLGYGDIGCFGSKRFKTPNIDSLAAKGMKFTDFHSNGAVCSPTRAALLTGRYQQRTGITGVVTARNHRHTGLDLQETTFAEIAKEAGYTTGMFGKWHVGYLPKYNPVHQGFDEFIGYVSGNVDYHLHIDQTGIEDWWKEDSLKPEKGYTTDLIANHGVEFIRRNKEKPFLLYLAQEAPHYPYQGRKDPPVYVPNKGKTKRSGSIETYREMIEVMDEGVGRILQAVDDADISTNTFIIFLSDNGPSGFGSAGQLRGKKGQIWEGGHRVPAIACWPGRIKAGSVSHLTAMGADLLPTITEMIGASQPKDVKWDGISLLDHLTGEKPLPPRPLFWGCKNRLAVRKGDYKLITTKSFRAPTLYNLNKDLGEKHNIAAEHPELTEELLKLLREWHQDVNKGVSKRS